MGRFDHLEMSDWQARRAEGDQTPPGVLDQDYYLSKAREAFAEERFEPALGYYSRALQYDIALEEAWLGQLRCLIELNELPEAVVWSDRAMERFPRSAQILSARAIAEARLGRQQSAMGFSDAAFSAVGVNAYCWVARGDVLIPVQLANAKACFAKAIELAPRDWSVRAWIARAYLTRRHYHLAATHYNQAVSLDEERFVCWFWLGRCHQTLGQIERARLSYRRSLQCCPSFKPAQQAIHSIEHQSLGSRIIGSVRRAFGRTAVDEG